jgi:hypothetical protein
VVRGDHLGGGQVVRGDHVGGVRWWGGGRLPRPTTAGSCAVEAAPVAVGEGVGQDRWEALANPERHRRKYGPDLKVVSADAGHAEVDEPADGAVDLGVATGTRAEAEERSEVDEIDLGTGRPVVQPVGEPSESQDRRWAEDRQPVRLDVCMSGVEPLLLDLPRHATAESSSQGWRSANRGWTDDGPRSPSSARFLVHQVHPDTQV